MTSDLRKYCCTAGVARTVWPLVGSVAFHDIAKPVKLMRLKSGGGRTCVPALRPADRTGHLLHRPPCVRRSGRRCRWAAVPAGGCLPAGRGAHRRAITTLLSHALVRSPQPHATRLLAVGGGGVFREVVRGLRRTRRGRAGRIARRGGRATGTARRRRRARLAAGVVRPRAGTAGSLQRTVRPRAARGAAAELRSRNGRGQSNDSDQEHQHQLLHVTSSLCSSC